jgi:hypothetical protein
LTPAGAEPRELAGSKKGKGAESEMDSDCCWSFGADFGDLDGAFFL